MTVRLSIRARLTVLYVVALGVAYVVLGMGTCTLARTSLEGWVDRIVGDRAEALAEEVQLSPEGPTLRLEAHKANLSGGDSVLLADGSGRHLMQQGAVDWEALDSAAARAALNGQPAASTGVAPDGQIWRVAGHPILRDGQVAAVVLVAHDLREVREVLATMQRLLTSLLPLALLVAGGLAWWLTGQVLAPVDRMASSAAEISHQDLSGRLPVSPDELGRLALVVNSLLARLQGAFERQRRFTADASHELRTPISVIQAATSRALLHERTGPEYREALTQVNEASQHMGRVVAQLLTLARLDRKEPVLECEPVALAPLLSALVEQFEEVSGRALDAPRVPPGASVWGDETALIQVFSNLLDNAVRYVPDGRRIWVEVRPAGELVEVEVGDEGEGIPPEHLAGLFERFSRGPRGTSTRGAGLGLAIAAELVRAQGGTLTAVRGPDVGARFLVRLAAA